MLLALILVTSINVNSFENPFYLIGEPNQIGNSQDTFAIVTFDPVPEIHKSTNIEIMYFPKIKSNGMTFITGRSNICKCLWESKEINVNKQIERGDTIIVNFKVIPRVIGTHSYRIDASGEKGGRGWASVPIEFTLDEAGKTVTEDNPPNISIGTLGLLPETISDSIVIIDPRHCYLQDRFTKKLPKGPGFSIDLILKPPFRDGEISNIHYEITSYNDFPYGAGYKLSYTNNFDVISIDSIGWNDPISKGDVITLDVQAKAVEDGAGSLI